MTTKKAPLEAEAKELDGETTTVRTFTYKGKDFSIESDAEKWSLEAMLAYEDGKSITVMRALLGDDQWAKFMETKPTNRDFADFSEQAFNTIGVSTGESTD